MSKRIEIDGSHGEGGGQVLRTSLALSLITGKPFRLFNVRAGREKPGLQPQHLMSVKAAAIVGNAQMRGASIGSSDLSFEPGEVRAGTYRFDIGTAGATGLVLHTIYLPLALRGRAASEITITGGTHVRTSPAFPFLGRTWQPYLERMGLTIRLTLERPGFYPRGGGEIRAVIPACSGLKGVIILLPLRGARGDEKRVSGVAGVAGLDAGIAKRMARTARQALEKHGLVATISEEEWEGGPGCAIALSLEAKPVASTFCVAGERGKPAEAVAKQAVDELVAHHAAGAPVDLHSADQLLLPLSLAEGPSEYAVAEVTRHLTTNADVIRRFLEREIVIEGAEGSVGVVKVGAGSAV
jgi:RNA 3'-terminal phosphate cyclase (ATP)